MSGIIDKRKRSREDDVSCESTPLSKRINNLHLSNFEEAHYNNLHQEPHHSQHNHHNFQPQQQSKDLNTHHHSSHTSMSSNGLKSPNGVNDDKNSYDPESNESDVDKNPYDRMNKLLHELHLERLKRCAV